MYAFVLDLDDRTECLCEPPWQPRLHSLGANDAVLAKAAACCSKIVDMAVEQVY